MARPTIYDHPMTPAERMRRHRALKANPLAPPDTSGIVLPEIKSVRYLEEMIARMTRKQQAAHVGCSLRQWYYIREFSRYREIKWSGDVLNGRYGRVGAAFLAWVCKCGDRNVQRLIHDRIKKKGARAGRALWLDLLRDSRG